MTPWREKILEQLLSLLRTDFFRVFKFPALFCVLDRWKKGGKFQNPEKIGVLESFSNIFFPLAAEKIARKMNKDYRGKRSQPGKCQFKPWRSLFNNVEKGYYEGLV